MNGLALNTATTRRQWGLSEAVDACRRHGLAGIVPWVDQVREFGVTRSARVLHDSGVPVTGYCRGGMFPAKDAQGRRRALDDNRRIIEEAVTIGAPVVVLVCGGLPPESRDLDGARAMVRDGIRSIMKDAEAADVRLAIEPLHPMQAADRSCINTLAQANDLCDELEPDGPGVLGVAVDAYHVWWDPLFSGEIMRAGRSRLLGFHLCDWLVPTRDVVTDRGMMGDGVVDLPGMAAIMRDAGYAGTPEVEIFSEYWWSRPPDDVVSTALARARPILETLSYE